MAKNSDGNGKIYKKRNVDYRSDLGSLGKDAQVCGFCKFFVPPSTGLMPRKKGDCELVQGKIDATYTCNLWAPREDMDEEEY